MIKVNGLGVPRIPVNGKETLRVMKNGEQLWSGTGLPSGYTLLEYIESTGEQYIDTGFKPNQDTRMVVDFASTKINAINNIVGARNSTTQNAFAFSIGSGGKWRMGYNTSSPTTSVVADTNRHIVDLNKNVLKLDSTTIYTATSGEFSCTLPIYIGDISEDSSAYNGYAKFYSCKIYDDGILIRDYIPCMNPEGICGLFDKVERVFYQSASSTQFSGDYFEEVEYIESTGSQYIDTVIRPNNNTRVVMDVYMPLVPTATSSFFGSRTSASSKNYAALYASSSGKVRSDYGSVYTQEFELPTARFIIDKNKETTIINGETKSYANSSFQGDYNLYLFASNNAGSLTWQSSFKLYSCQIYDNAVLVRDFIPVKGIISGTYGLYDKVNKQLYGSASSTPFTGA